MGNRIYFLIVILIVGAVVWAARNGVTVQIAATQAQSSAISSTPQRILTAVPLSASDLEPHPGAAEQLRRDHEELEIYSQDEEAEIEVVEDEEKIPSTICLVRDQGKTKKLAVGRQTACMTARACLEFASHLYTVDGPMEREECMKDGAQALRLPDEEVEQIVQSSTSLAK